MNYKIWNKKDNINGIEPQYFIDDLKIQESDGIFLIVDDFDNVQAIEIDRIIKSVYKLDKDLTVDQVAQEYVKIKERESIQAGKDNITLEEQAKKIDILEAENKELKSNLQATQQAVDFIIMNNGGI